MNLKCSNLPVCASSDSSQTPGLTSNILGFVNVHRVTVLFVPRWLLHFLKHAIHSVLNRHIGVVSTVLRLRPSECQQSSGWRAPYIIIRLLCDTLPFIFVIHLADISRKNGRAPTCTPLKFTRYSICCDIHFVQHGAESWLWKPRWGTPPPSPPPPVLKLETLNNSISVQITVEGLVFRYCSLNIIISYAFPCFHISVTCRLIFMKIF